MPGPRTLVLGLDGGSWELLRPALDAGRLPQLARRLASAASATLTSVDPPVTLPAWYCAFTGASPGRLDVWGFTAPGDAPGRFQPVTSYRPQEAIWDRLSRRGVRVGVVNAPVLPAPAVNGYFLSGMLDAPPGVPRGYPGDLLGRLERELGPWAFDLPTPSPGALDDFVEGACRSIEQKVRAVELLEEAYAPEFLFVLFSETDRLQHEAFPEMLRSTRVRSPRWDPFWATLDRAIARLVSLVHDGGDGGNTWLLSDHGFGPAEGYFFTNRFLVSEGFLRLRPGAPWARAVASDLAARVDVVLPLDRIVRRLAPGRPPGAPGAASGPGPKDLTFSAFARYIDWESTRAFSFPTPEAVYANPYRRAGPPEPAGPLREDLLRAFSRVPAAALEVLVPKDLYAGPPGPHQPLLLLRSHGYAWETRGDFNHHGRYLRRRPSYFRRQGTHRKEGILAVFGPRVRPGPLPRAVPLLSLAPTLASSLGLPWPSPRDAEPDPELLSALGSPEPPSPSPGAP